MCRSVVYVHHFSRKVAAQLSRSDYPRCGTIKWADGKGQPSVIKPPNMYYWSPFCGSYPAITGKDSSELFDSCVRGMTCIGELFKWLDGSKSNLSAEAGQIFSADRSQRNFKTSLPHRMCGDIKLHSLSMGASCNRRLEAPFIRTFLLLSEGTFHGRWWPSNRCPVKGSSDRRDRHRLFCSLHPLCRISDLHSVAD